MHPALRAFELPLCLPEDSGWPARLRRSLRAKAMALSCRTKSSAYNTPHPPC